MKYEAPICEILKFGKEDILTLSGNGNTNIGDDVTDTNSKWLPSFNWSFGQRL